MPWTPPADQRADPADALRAGSALRRSAAQAIAWVGAGLVAFLSVAAWLGASAWFPPKALVLFAAAMVLMWVGLAAHAPNRRFGAANAITLTRLALIALLAAAVGEPVGDAAVFGWCVLALASVAALLDAVDGPIARRRHEASAFGARFDMESDALLVLVLSALVLHLGKAGAWVLAAGAMRYAFVAAGWVWPRLAQPLPERLRRKVVCVLQIVCLIVCLCPWLTPPASSALAAAGLLALAASFLMDLLWLVLHPPSAPEHRA